MLPEATPSNLHVAIVVFWTSFWKVDQTWSAAPLSVFAPPLRVDEGDATALRAEQKPSRAAHGKTSLFPPHADRESHPQFQTATNETFFFCKQTNKPKTYKELECFQKGDLVQLKRFDIVRVSLKISDAVIQSRTDFKGMPVNFYIYLGRYSVSFAHWPMCLLLA